ncbi:hypothetical protein HY988_06385 [Candidatus Micrarchaeota archaeon]|nr:hypothetical protein [Candidatus Micrarchaeota archaeon]
MVTKKGRDWRAKTAIPVRTDLNSMEKEALMRTRSTLDSISEFLIKWEKAKSRPSGMINQVDKIKNFYNTLRVWYDEVSVEGDEKEREERLARLVNFVTICRSYW